MKYPTSLLAALLLVAGACDTFAVEGTPDYIDYQGRVLDNAGAPLGTKLTGAAPNQVRVPDPTNYTIQFRIWDKLSGGVLLWSEAQIVTVTDGQFSVRLAQGSTISADGLSPVPPLKDVFSGATRYLGVTVLPAGATSAGEIVPRLAFLPTAYAMVAQRAKDADSADRAKLADQVAQASGTSTFDTTTIKTATITNATVSQNVNVTGNVTANLYNGKGSGITELNASNISTGTVNDARLSSEIPTKKGSNKFDGINEFTNVANIFTGNGQNLLLNATNLTAGTVPSARLSTDIVDGYMRDRPLLLRQPNDGFHALVFGSSSQTIKVNITGSTLSNAATIASMWGNIDGPVLTGNRDGALGNVYLDGNDPKGDTALKWSRTSVDIYHDLVLATGKKLVVQNDIVIKDPQYTDKWIFRQAKRGGEQGNVGAEMRLIHRKTPENTSDENAGYWWWGDDAVAGHASDLRLKKDIVSVGPVLASVLKLRPVFYRMKSLPSAGPKAVGFIAQEVQPVFPDTVSEHSGFLGLSYEDFGVYSIKAIQELAAETRGDSAEADAEIKKLQEENAALRQHIDMLEQRLDAVEARLK